MAIKYLDYNGLSHFLDKLDERYVPTLRTINGKALTTDISLSASDVSALPSNTSYLASASASGNTLTITQSSGGAISYTPSFTDTNYYPSRSYSSGLQISTSQGVTDTCSLFVPYALADLGGGAVSTTEQYFAGIKGFNNGIKLKETGSYYATLKGDSSVSSNITLTLPSATGTLALVSDIPSGDVDVTINGTATATIQTLSNIIVGTTTYKNLTTFTGTSTTTGTPSGTTTVPTSSHTHSITLSGSRTTTGSGTTARRKLTISGISSATSSTTSVASSGHNHTFTAQGSLS